MKINESIVRHIKFTMISLPALATLMFLYWFYATDILYTFQSPKVYMQFGEHEAGFLYSHVLVYLAYMGLYIVLTTLSIFFALRFYFERFYLALVLTFLPWGLVYIFLAIRYS